MVELEHPDALIALSRAAELSQILEPVLLAHAEVGRLRALQREGEWQTSRRWLHHYLLNDLGDHRSLPLPRGYVPPPGEPQRKLRRHHPVERARVASQQELA